MVEKGVAAMGERGGRWRVHVIKLSRQPQITDTVSDIRIPARLSQSRNNCEVKLKMGL